MKHVVVGGGSGFIGTHIINTLRAEGVTCTCVSRMPGPNKISWQEIEKTGLPSTTSAVINIAGQNILNPAKRWTPGFKQNVYNSRVKTTKLLADAVKSTNASVFTTISGVAYYPPDNNEYNEESVCEPYDFLSELCRDWEAAAKLPDNSKIRQVVIRSGVVLGKGGGIRQQIYLPFMLGLGGPLGDGKQYMPWIHVKDLVGIFLFSLKNNNVNGILNGVAPQLITNNEFTKAFASAIRRPALIPVPSFALNLIFDKERAKIMLEGQKVLPKRVMDLGFEYKYPDIQSACKEIVS